MKTSHFYQRKTSGIIHSISFFILIGGHMKICIRHFDTRARLALFIHEILEYGV